MKGVLTVVGLAVAALVASVGLAAPGDPVLRTATQSNGHLIVTFNVHDLEPGVIEAATSPATGRSGSFLPTRLRLREKLIARPDAVTGLARWRTRATLHAGTYYLKVSGIEADGVTDCPRQLPNCLVHWSNVRKVVVRAAALG